MVSFFQFKEAGGVFFGVENSLCHFMTEAYLLNPRRRAAI
jgi:hypothetical protein